MKILKKILILLSVFIVLTCGVSMSACARVDSGPMEHLTGTYRLYNYSRTMNDGTEQTEKTVYNYFKDKHIQMYFVITGEDIGYIAYKDDETALFVKEVRITYNYDIDEPTYISTVEFKTADSSSYYDIKSSWSNLGFLDKQHKLNNVHHKYEGFLTDLLYTEYVDFERVSRDVDLTYIIDKLGSGFEVIEYI